jgi:flagellar protein FliL
MAEQAVADRISEDLVGSSAREARGPAAQPSGKGPVAFIVLLNLLVGGAGAAAYLSLPGDSPSAMSSAAPAEGLNPPMRQSSITYDVPDMLVTLNGTEGESAQFKISLAVEVENQAAVERLRTVMPLVMDKFQVYLRELGTEDLTGPAGADRVRDELSLRVNAAIRPEQVRDVRVKEIRVQ